MSSTGPLESFVRGSWDWFKAAAVLSVVAYVIWIAWPYHWWLSDTRTVYLAYCDQFDGTNCLTSWRRDGKGPRQFTVLKDQQAVIEKAEDGTLTRQACVVLDANNWNCSRARMTDGNYEIELVGAGFPHWKEVSRYRWYELKRPGGK